MILPFVRSYSDVVDAEFASEVCQDDMTVGELHLELSLGQNFDDFAFGFDDVYFRHNTPYILFLS